MALDYFAPGVYVEEVDRGSRPIEGISLSVAGFIGFTEDVRGDAELFKPIMITNWEQYRQYFAKPDSDGFTDFGAYLPFAVQGWFLNGGGRCWITSIGTKLPGSETPEPKDIATKVFTSSGKPSLAFNIKSQTLALPPGESDTESDDSSALAITSRIQVIITDSKPKELENGGKPPVDSGEYFTVTIKDGPDELEKYEHLINQTESQYGDYVITAVQESQYVTIENLATAGGPLSRRPRNGQYEVTSAPHITERGDEIRELQGQKGDRQGMQGNFEVDDIAIIACPDLMLLYQKNLINLDQVHGVMEAMISNCENSFPGPAFRMVVLDAPPVKPGKNNNLAVPPEKQTPQDVAEWLKQFNRRSMFGALYYPWIQVANPRDKGKPIFVPPCGHMMGIWCRTDEDRGIFKAPANETPRGVTGIAYDTNMREQQLLNPQGINCIRNFSSYSRGLKVWGARTLVEPDNIQWRYISVRRLVSYIEKSIEIGTQWVVFEPNDMDLWERVKRTVSTFLERLWRDGALFGSSPAEAFYVKCDGDINTHDTMMLGRLYVEVGVSPVRPAEFVIFRVSQWSPNE
ncbi:MULTISPECIES: phage tail sheath C-terminal domain-containing protein [unclassified Anabaena]|uniref:phage tail sheath family protein n=1 Tax=unclassified Anabaena TaxID=2619674 RepID=UPI0014450CD3|nr:MULTISPECIES: phage tail sheath C-terminal domain-containing protein [unclassified Anabaena]MTJ10515.1 phage tail sheath family protein [Anabaena sp. UHCC 0204]MTJ56010.1 phage tail sheath family protein [Anabaena sp. UHCC 0253]